MTQTDQVHEGALRRVDPDGGAGADVQSLSPQVECSKVELVEATGRVQHRSRLTAWDGDVDGGGDRVDEAMPSERCLQAQRGAGHPLGDLDQIKVSQRGVGPPVDAASEGDDLSGVAEPIQANIADAGRLSVAVREGVAE
jgi:hypothetical protein